MPTIDLSILPVNAQQELLDFYEFLQEKYAHRKASLEALTQQQAAQTDFKTWHPSFLGLHFFQ